MKNKGEVLEFEFWIEHFSMDMWVYFNYDLKLTIVQGVCYSIFNACRAECWCQGQFSGLIWHDRIINQYSPLQ